MAKLRLSKNSLQQQQQQLKLYKRLLPSLDLKRRQLTVEAQKARTEHKAAMAAAELLDVQIGEELPMLADAGLDLGGLVEMTGYRVGEQNVVGTRLPILDHIEFAVADYSRLATPAWLDILVGRLKDAAEARVRAALPASVCAARSGRPADHAAGKPLREDPDPDREKEYPANPHLSG
jgi:V/A-type H+-transporting ATPase subunit D